MVRNMECWYQSSQYGNVRLPLGNVHASFRTSGADKERCCPAACATSPMMVGRDRSFRNWIVFLDRGPMSRSSCTTHVAVEPASGARFQNSARNTNKKSVESVQQCHTIRQKQSSGGRPPLSPAPAPIQAGNTRAHKTIPKLDPGLTTLDSGRPM